MKTEPTEVFRAMANDLKYNFGVIHSNPQLILEESFISGVRYGQSSPKIKQLEWEEYRDCLVSTTPFYNVSIKEVCGIYELATAYSAFIKSYNSLDKAKEVAQSDFEQRVKECLE